MSFKSAHTSNMLPHRSLTVGRLINSGSGRACNTLLTTKQPSLKLKNFGQTTLRLSPINFRALCCYPLFSATKLCSFRWVCMFVLGPNYVHYLPVVALIRKSKMCQSKISPLTNHRSTYEGWKIIIVNKKFLTNNSCGLYYKHITIVIDAAIVISKWRSKL